MRNVSSVYRLHIGLERPQRNRHRRCFRVDPARRLGEDRSTIGQANHPKPKAAQMSPDSSTGSPAVGSSIVLDNGRYFEGPRWHAGRLWFVDCFARTLLSVGPAGDCEQHAKLDDDTPCGLGILPDGSVIVLTMFRKRLLKYANGQLSLYADLSQIATGTIDDMITDGLGRCYVGDLGFDLPPPPDRGAVGRIILVQPDGQDARGRRGPAVSQWHRGFGRSQPARGRRDGWRLLDRLQNRDRWRAELASPVRQL
jgi:hypothetical protein